jgi:hypothetical protein
MRDRPSYTTGRPILLISPTKLDAAHRFPLLPNPRSFEGAPRPCRVPQNFGCPRPRGWSCLGKQLCLRISPPHFPGFSPIVFLTQPVYHVKGVI